MARLAHVGIFGLMSIPLRAQNVTRRYESAVALDSVSLDVPAGGAVALAGESGSGKTTLLRCFNRMVHPDAGDVFVDGANVRDADAIALRRQLGYVPQHGGLLPHWNVQANVGLVLRAMRRRDERDAVSAALDLVGLPVAQYGDRYPGALSGGQRQRVALARALAARPGALLMDEPFGALDAITRDELQRAFEDVRRELGVTVILVTHDLAEAARLGDEIAVMRSGRVEQQGSIGELRRAPATGYVAALVERALAQHAALAGQ